MLLTFSIQTLAANEVYGKETSYKILNKKEGKNSLAESSNFEKTIKYNLKVIDNCGTNL
jgi:hypothetical protein